MDKTLYYMQQAIEQAEIAAAENEVPVGAVIVRNNEIVATGRNRREQGKNALLHAETEAIYNACQKLGGWRLWNCEIYVTLEPCPMCAGAIINAHIPKVYFGAYDLKNGACGTITNLFQLPVDFTPASVGVRSRPFIFFRSRSAAAAACRIGLALRESRPVSGRKFHSFFRGGEKL